MDLKHHSDPGLQPERTSLSWTRTVLSLVICAVTMLRWGHAFPQSIYALSGVMVLVVAAVAASTRNRYARQNEGITRGAIAPAPGAVALLAGSLVLLAASELVLILVSG